MIYRAEVVPCITAAIWEEGGQVKSDDEWDGFVRHGGRLISPYVANFGRTLKPIAENYNLAPEQLSLLIRIYNHRIAQKGGGLLSEDALKDLFSHGDAGKAEAENLLQSIGVFFS